MSRRSGNRGKDKARKYRSRVEPTWCRGCSYFSVLKALTESFANLEADPDKLNVISGIGCSSRLPFFLNTYSMHTLHGRAVPVAIGVHLSRPEGSVVVVAGDGDLFSIGTTHFVHAARQNLNLTVVCLNNRMYAMTKRQTSPTSACGFDGSLTPYGSLSPPLNTIEFAISCGATCVCRSISGDVEHMKAIFETAYRHNGFSYLEIISPCTTYDSDSSIRDIPIRACDMSREHNFSDRNTALLKASKAFDFDYNSSATIPTGIFWKTEKETYGKMSDKQVERVKATQPDSFLELISSLAVKKVC